MRVVCIVPELKSQCESIAEACYRLTPDIAIRADHAVFLEISRCKGLYSEPSLRLRLERVLHKLRTRARVAYADTPAEALARIETPTGGLPISVLPYYWSPFQSPRDDARRDLEKMLSRLKALGIETLDEFVELPKKILAARLGKSGALLIERIHAAHLMPWPKWTPTLPLAEHVDLATFDVVPSSEGLLFYLLPALERLLARLRGRCHRLSRLELSLLLEAHSASEKRPRVFTLAFPIAQTTAQGVIPLIREQLDARLSRDPLAAPVERIDLRALETTPGSGMQKHFFSTTEERDEAIGSFLARVQAKAGKSRVFSAELVERHLPERSWNRIPLEKSMAKASALPTEASPVPLRPLRLFTPPEPLHRVGRFLMAKGRRWTLQGVLREERISGDWWESGFRRTYYTIATDEARLWIFRDQSGGLFLHGIFE